MLGQIVYSAQGKGRLKMEETTLHGLPVLRAAFDPAGRWAPHRLTRAGKRLKKAGIRRVLVPEGFSEWEILSCCGLRPVAPDAFLRAHAAQLTLAALERQGKRPEQCAVALRALRVDRDVVRTAETLCRQVRDVCISAPEGGEQLRDRLRWEYGAAVRPDFEHVAAAVRFDPRTWQRAEALVDLFPPGPDPRCAWVNVPGLEGEETEHFPLLAALWEEKRLKNSDLEFT